MGALVRSRRRRRPGGPEVPRVPAAVCGQPPPLTWSDTRSHAERVNLGPAATGDPAGVGSGDRGADMAREGPFWDMVEGRAPPPAVAELLGWKLVAVDPDTRTIEIEFTATEQFLNPLGNIQGGMLAAMLDDTLGPALVATLDADQFSPTTDLHVQFLRPAHPGRLVGRGRVVRRGRQIAFLAGELVDDSGTVVATAVATAQIRDGQL